MKTCPCVHAALLWEWTTFLVYYYNARTVEDGTVRKGQVVLEGRECFSVSVPEEEILQRGGQQEMAGTRTRTHTHTHTFMV